MLLPMPCPLLVVGGGGFFLILRKDFAFPCKDANDPSHGVSMHFYFPILVVGGGDLLFHGRYKILLTSPKKADH